MTKIKDSINIHQQAIAIKENQHLYSNDELLKLCRVWRKDYNKYLLKNLEVLTKEL